MRGRPHSFLTLLAVCGGLAGSFASGCGAARQDSGEVPGHYTVRIVRASFPARQKISQSTRLELRVRNTSRRTLPNVAITLNSLSYKESFPHLSDPKRPVWIIDKGPGPRSVRPIQTNSVDPVGGGATAYVNTWALGPLAPGRARTFTWAVTAVKAGIHRVRFIVGGGLSGKARTVLPDGSLPTGRFVVNIAPEPGQTHVNPVTGQVAQGKTPLAKGPVGAVPAVP